MSRAVLSHPLPVFGLVGFYPANDLIGRSPLPRRLAALLRRDHGVLRTVSHAYPPPRGTFDRITDPSATCPLRGTFDLHALAMPPAFSLSQDQTLHLISIAPARSRSRGCLQMEVCLSTRLLQPGRSRRGSLPAAAERLARRSCRSLDVPPRGNTSVLGPGPGTLCAPVALPRPRSTPCQGDRRTAGARPQCLVASHLFTCQRRHRPALAGLPKAVPGSAKAILAHTSARSSSAHPISEPPNVARSLTFPCRSDPSSTAHEPQPGPRPASPIVLGVRGLPDNAASRSGVTAATQHQTLSCAFPSNPRVARSPSRPACVLARARTAAAHADIVAPVVRMSSTRTTTRERSATPGRGRKAPRTFARRRPGGSVVCERLCFRTSRRSKPQPDASATARAITAAWSIPRATSRRHDEGTGTITPDAGSMPLRRKAGASRWPRSSPRRRPVRRAPENLISWTRSRRSPSYSPRRTARSHARRRERHQEQAPASATTSCSPTVVAHLAQYRSSRSGAQPLSRILRSTGGTARPSQVSSTCSTIIDTMPVRGRACPGGGMSAGSRLAWRRTPAGSGPAQASAPTGCGSCTGRGGQMNPPEAASDGDGGGESVEGSGVSTLTAGFPAPVTTQGAAEESGRGRHDAAPGPAGARRHAGGAPAASAA